MTTIKKTIEDKKHGTILEPFFGYDKIILYNPEEKLKPGKYIVKLDNQLIPAGKDKRNIPVFIRKVTIINKIE